MNTDKGGYSRGEVLIHYVTTPPPLYYTALQKSVSAYLYSKQILAFGFARQYVYIFDDLSNLQCYSAADRSVWIHVVPMEKKEKAKIKRRRKPGRSCSMNAKLTGELVKQSS